MLKINTMQKNQTIYVLENLVNIVYTKYIKEWNTYEMPPTALKIKKPPYFQIGSVYLHRGDFTEESKSDWNLADNLINNFTNNFWKLIPIDRYAKYKWKSSS